MAKDYKIAARLVGHDEASSVFKRAARSIHGSLGGALGKVGGLVRGLGSALTSLPVLGSLFGGALGVGGLISWVTEFAAAGDVIAKTAKAAGVGAEFFQRLGHAAGLSGVATGEFAASIKKFGINMGGMRGKSGELYSFLRNVSPALLKALKATTSNEEALRLYMGAIAAVDDPAKRAKLAVVAFGEAGGKMALLAGEGGDAINKMMREADELGLVMGGAALRSAEGFTDEVARLNGAWSGFKAVFGTAFIQAALPYLQQATEWVKANRGEIGKWAKSFAVDLVDGIKSVVTALPSIAKSLADIAGTIGKIVGFVADSPWLLGVLGVGAVAKNIAIGGGAAVAGKAVAGGTAAGAGGKSLLRAAVTNPTFASITGAFSLAALTAHAIGNVPDLLYADSKKRSDAEAAARVADFRRRKELEAGRVPGSEQAAALRYAAGLRTVADPNTGVVTVRFAGLPAGATVERTGPVAVEGATGRRTQGR